MAGKKAGWRAPLWGAICGTIPDLDVISGSFMNVVESNAFHRTITHSLLFFLVMSPLLGYLIKRIHPDGPATRRDWTLLAFLALFTHALLDCFTTWGTALFWPWSYKVAFQSIFVIDPLYTLPLLFFLILAIRLPRTATKRLTYTWTGLAVSSAYLLLSLVCKFAATERFVAALEHQGIQYERMETRPAPLNIILWGVTAEVGDGYYTAYYSLLENKNKINFTYYPKQHDQLDPYVESENVRTLIDLTSGWYTIVPAGEDGGVLLNDLRFGTNRAWETGGSFIFSYHIRKQESGRVMVSQKEQAFDEPPSVILSKLARRILGKDKVTSL